MTKIFVFTLAEVLITLGIIGVVAAMTIPTLISNTNGAQFKTAYKKALSTLNQAVIMNIAIDDTDFSTLEADTANAGDPPTDGSMGSILDDRLQSATDITTNYFAEASVTSGTGQSSTTALKPLLYEYEHKCTGADDDTKGCEADNAGEMVDTSTTISNASATTWKVFSFADGTSFGYLKTSNNCSGISPTCIGFIDVNGSTGPNTPITCEDSENGSCKSEEITDIYPVFFHGQTVEPANDSARAVLFGK